MQQIKAIQSFAHAPSKKSFVQGRTYEVQDASAAEFVGAGLAQIVEELKAKPVAKNKGE